MLNLSTVTGLVENESMQLYSNLRKVGNLGAKGNKSICCCILLKFNKKLD